MESERGKRARAEREILARIRAGDPEAFEELFLAHYEGMCALAFGIVRSRDAAEDVAANVFRSLWLRHADWEPRGPLHTYLLTAARNEAISLYRRVRREQGLGDRVGATDTIPGLAERAMGADELVMQEALASAIERAGESLPRRCREVFFLRWREGLRLAEIAARMGISVKTVEMQMTRALRAIRDTVHGHR